MLLIPELRLFKRRPVLWCPDTLFPPQPVCLPLHVFSLPFSFQPRVLTHPSNPPTHITHSPERIILLSSFQRKNCFTISFFFFQCHTFSSLIFPSLILSVPALANTPPLHASLPYTKFRTHLPSCPSFLFPNTSAHSTRLPCPTQSFI